MEQISMWTSSHTFIQQNIIELQACDKLQRYSGKSTQSLQSFSAWKYTNISDLSGEEQDKRPGLHNDGVRMPGYSLNLIPRVTDTRTLWTISEPGRDMILLHSPCSSGGMGKVVTASHREKASGRSDWLEMESSWVATLVTGNPRPDSWSVGCDVSRVRGCFQWQREKSGAKRKEPLLPALRAHKLCPQVHLPLSGGSMMSWEEQKPPPGLHCSSPHSCGLHFPHRQRGRKRD